MHRQIHFTPPREILDVAVPAVLRTPRYRPCALAADLGEKFVFGTRGVDVLRFGG